MSSRQINTLVFSGGGINGLSFLGCIRALEEYNILSGVKCLLGTSAGSMVSLLISIGYSSDELTKIIMNINMNDLKDITSDNILSYFNNYGLDSGNKIIKVFEIFLRNKGIADSVTFQELYNLTNKHLIITGTNLSYKRAEYFDYKDFPNMKILEALRISISIPFIFKKCEFNGCIYGDGSIMANYPIYYFDNKDNILGFLITENYDYQEINSIDLYSLSILNSLLKKDTEMMDLLYDKYTVYIHKQKNMLKFDITSEDKHKLFESGYQSTISYLNTSYKENHILLYKDVLEDIKKNINADNLKI